MTMREEQRKYAKEYRELAKELMTLHSKASNVISRLDNNCVFEMSLYLKKVASRITRGYRDTNYNTLIAKRVAPPPSPIPELVDVNTKLTLGQVFDILQKHLGDQTQEEPKEIKDDYGRPGIILCEAEVEKLRAAVNEAEPHEHFEGMNECAICDESLLLAAVRLIKKAKKT